MLPLLRGVQYLDLAWDDWRAAAHLGRQPASRGHQLPLSDVALAAVALRNDIAVYPTHPHFDLIPDWKRYYPE